MSLRRCEDCAVECGAPATWRVLDGEGDDQGEWFYCDEHVPYLDPGVEVFPYEPMCECGEPLDDEHDDIDCIVAILDKAGDSL